MSKELTPTELREWKQARLASLQSEREKEAQLREWEMKEIFDKLEPSADSVLNSILRKLRGGMKYEVAHFMPAKDMRFGKYFARWLSDQLEDVISGKVEVDHICGTKEIKFIVKAWDNASCDAKLDYMSVPFLIILMFTFIVGFIGFQLGKRYA
jgi:hypothetical protein